MNTLRGAYLTAMLTSALSFFAAHVAKSSWFLDGSMTDVRCFVKVEALRPQSQSRVIKPCGKAGASRAGETDPTPPRTLPTVNRLEGTRRTADLSNQAHKAQVKDEGRGSFIERLPSRPRVEKSARFPSQGSASAKFARHQRAPSPLHSSKRTSRTGTQYPVAWRAARRAQFQTN